MRIFLIGFMGSGKTTLGRKLAQKLNCAFVDLDERISAHTGKSISALFAELGETGFRKLEQEVLHTTQNDTDLVVSTGGGTPCFFDNIDWMNQQGKTIYMHVPVGALAIRLENSKTNRPLIGDRKGEELQAFIADKLAEREAYYQKAQMMVSGLDMTADKMLMYLEAAQLR
ncbi:MAG: shikimate kinase [Sphingobacteriaceae bacterium]